MLFNILIGVAAILVIFIIVVAMQPNDFRTTRSLPMAGPASAAFDQVNDLHNWADWSPWAKMDPNMKLTYDGPRTGTGAKYAWVGNKQVGEGRMTIIESRPSDLVRLKLEFLKPFTATNEAEFTFKPEGNKTNVTWSMIGKKNFVFKAMGLLMNMDKMVGNDFEKGLAGIKTIVEKTA